MLRKIAKVTIMTPCLAVLAACGGATTNNVGGFANHVINANTLLASAGGVAIANADATPPASVPLSGSANYDGYMALVFEGNTSDLSQIANADMIGQTNLTADFAATGGTISGTANNFYDQAANAYIGSLTVETGTINRGADAVTFGGAMSGTLTGAGVGAGAYNGTYLGSFSSPQPQPVAILGGQVASGGTERLFKGVFFGLDGQ